MMSNYSNYSNYQNLVIAFDDSWFLAKILSNFVSLPWKLHNRYCHIVRKTHVLVVTPPVFLSKTANFVATPEGDVLRLPCKASGSPKPVIEWRINGFPVKEFGASVNPNTGDLVISSAKGEIHSGFYQCFATNKAGQIVSKSFAQVGDSILSNSDDYDAFDEVESVRDFQVSPIYWYDILWISL